MDITGKKFSDIIKEAEIQGIQIVLLEPGAEIGKYAELIANMVKHESVLIVPIDTLPLEDQEKIKRIPIEERNYLKEIIDNNHAIILNDISRIRLEVDIATENLFDTKRNYTTLPKMVKPQQGYAKNFKTNFKGRKRH